MFVNYFIHLTFLQSLAWNVPSVVAVVHDVVVVVLDGDLRHCRWEIPDLQDEKGEFLRWSIRPGSHRQISQPNQIRTTFLGSEHRAERV